MYSNASCNCLKLSDIRVYIFDDGQYQTQRYTPMCTCGWIYKPHFSIPFSTKIALEHLLEVHVNPHSENIDNIPVLTYTI